MAQRDFFWTRDGQRIRRKPVPVVTTPPAPLGDKGQDPRPSALPAFLGVGLTDQFSDGGLGISTSTAPTYMTWAAQTNPAFVAGPGNTVPDTLSGNPVLRVTKAGIYIVTCTIAQTVSADTQVRFDGAVVQNGTGLFKTLNAQILPIPAGPYNYSQIGPELTFAFGGEVNDIFFLRVTQGTGTGTAQVLATALSIT